MSHCVQICLEIPVHFFAHMKQRTYSADPKTADLHFLHILLRANLAPPPLGPPASPLLGLFDPQNPGGRGENVAPRSEAGSTATETGR